MVPCAKPVVRARSDLLGRVGVEALLELNQFLQARRRSLWSRAQYGGWSASQWLERGLTCWGEQASMLCTSSTSSFRPGAGVCVSVRKTVVGARADLLAGPGLSGGQAPGCVLLRVDSEHPAGEHAMLEAGSMLGRWRMGRRWWQSIRWMD